MTRLTWWSSVVSAAVVLGGCTGPSGSDGKDGAPCSVQVLDGGSARILCADGTAAFIPAGPQGAEGAQGGPGAAGSSCTVSQVDAGVKVISCSDGTEVTVTDGANGTNGTNGSNGAPGTPGASLGVEVTTFHGTAKLDADLAAVGKVPATVNITEAAVDASGVVTVRFNVTTAKADGGTEPYAAYQGARFTVAKLVPAGVGEVTNRWVPYITRTVTVPVDATGYPNPPGTQVLQAYRESNGTFVNEGGGAYRYTFATNLSTATFSLGGAAVGYDPSLTHRVAVMVGGTGGPLGSDSYDFVPNGAARTEQRDVVDTASCRQCHGKGFKAHGGDRTEVSVCVTCHNPSSTDAYTGNTVDMMPMIHKIHAGSELPSVAGADGIVWDDPATPADESADNHPYTIGRNPTGWWKAEFPAHLANCTKCHVGTQAGVDNWKEKPSTAACTSCHDTLDLVGGTNHQVNGVPNPVTQDSMCKGCHKGSGPETALLKPTPNMHDWVARDERLQPEFNVSLSMTPPANGTYYVAGEAPSVRVQLSLPDGGTVDHNQLLPDSAAEGCVKGTPCVGDGLYTATNFFVHGPRANPNPVLTTRARVGVIASSSGPYDLSASGANLVLKLDNGVDVVRMINGADTVLKGTVTVPVSSGSFASTSAVTGPELVAWLNGNAAFSARAIAYLDEKTGKPALRSRNLGAFYALQLQSSVVATQVFGGDVTLHQVTGYTPSNTLAKASGGGTNDARVTYASDAVTYQLDPVDDLVPGTYTAQVEIAEIGRVSATNFKTPSVAMLDFQVGQASTEKQVAGNCNLCHQNAEGKGQVFDPSRHNKIFSSDAMTQCTACHDHQPGGATGLTWPGAQPMSSRVHAVHNGSKLAYPNATVAHADEIPGRNWDISFPQDIRNCQTCHADGQVSTAWKTNPNRLACGGCHDTDSATAHIRLMTWDPTPADAFSGDEKESCQVCH